MGKRMMDFPLVVFFYLFCRYPFLRIPEIVSCCMYVYAFGICGTVFFFSFFLFVLYIMLQIKVLY